MALLIEDDLAIMYLTPMEAFFLECTTFHIYNEAILIWHGIVLLANLVY